MGHSHASDFYYPNNMVTYEWMRLKVIENEHIPPPLYLYGTLGYMGKLCALGGMNRNERVYIQQGREQKITFKMVPVCQSLTVNYIKFTVFICRFHTVCKWHVTVCIR